MTYKPPLSHWVPFWLFVFYASAMVQAAQILSLIELTRFHGGTVLRLQLLIVIVGLITSVAYWFFVLHDKVWEALNRRMIAK